MQSNLDSRRRGSVYVVVLGTSMIITVIGLSALMVTRIQRRSAEGTSDLIQARLHALSAIEMGLHWINDDSNWRLARANGIWEQSKALGSGTYDLKGADPNDGNLSNGDTEPVILTGIGYQGGARYKLEVELVAQLPPLNCLDSALHAAENMILSGTVLQSDRTISTNTSVVAVAAWIDADVEAVETVTGGTYNGEITEAVAARDMPDASAFDHYIARGTPIDINLLAHKNHFDLQDVVLSPAHNPYGAANSEGIYVIDCQGGELRIKNCRIVGTLVLLDPDSASKTEMAVNWEPAVANYPVLLVRGSFNLSFDSMPLSEVGRGVNFNPLGTPFEGVEDVVATGSYPSTITGLIYVSGTLNTSNSVTIDGVVVVGGPVSAGGNLNLTHDRTYMYNPPPGFTGPPHMVIADGTWRQVVD